MKEEDGPLFMKSGDWFPKWKEGGVSFAHQPFFVLDSQVIRIFRLKNRLIILRAVTYVIRRRICSRVARDQPGNYWLAIILEMAAC